MAFTGFKVQGSAEEFNKQIGGSTFLDIGVHDVTILSVEAGETITNGVGFLKFTWQHDDGRTHQERIYPVAKGGGFSFGYNQLFSLIDEDDGTLRSVVFGDYLPQDVKRFGALVGLKATIKIVEATQGFDVMKNDLGGFYLVDLATENNEQIGEEIFPDRKLAVEHGKGLGLYRGFPGIKTIEGRDTEANTVAIKAAMTGGTKVIGRKTSM